MDTKQNRIIELKQKKDCFVMAHNYVDYSIQEVADYVGDSLQMAKVAATRNEKMLLVCSIRIMGETAKLLNPEKKVLMAHPTADCRLANMQNPFSLRKLRDEHPDAEVVCYVNSPATLKAESTITCTSANCVELVSRIPEDKEIIFIPDRNIGRWVEYKTGRKLIMFDSYCYVHHQIELEEAQAMKEKYPDYTLLVHPECGLDVCKFADVVCSTSQMIDYVQHNDRCIIGTEIGLYEQLRHRFPEKSLVPLSPRMQCEDMKLNHLDLAIDALENEKNEVVLDEAIAEPMARSLQRMAEIMR